jgi:hypothetical protein
LFIIFLDYNSKQCPIEGGQKVIYAVDIVLGTNTAEELQNKHDREVEKPTGSARFADGQGKNGSNEIFWRRTDDTNYSGWSAIEPNNRILIPRKLATGEGRSG